MLRALVYFVVLAVWLSLSLLSVENLMGVHYYDYSDVNQSYFLIQVCVTKSFYVVFTIFGLLLLTLCINPH